MAVFRGGYTGRMLRVDLDSHTISVEETPDVETWLGPRGWNALIGWREVGPDVGPFDAENRLVFSVGPLVGTSAPTAGRTTVSGVMPRGYPQPVWSTASMGGYWGAELKYAGYDGVIVQGQSDAPCYLLIEDDEVSLQDARDLWGKGTFETQEEIKDRHGDDCQIATIGPAGENHVRFASIIHRLSNAVGNGGLGGVMGAKRLKAIAVRGTQGVEIAEPEDFLEAVSYVWNLVKGGLSGVGRADGYPLIACTQGCSVKCGTSIRRCPAAHEGDLPVKMQKCNNGAWANGSHPEYEGVFVDGQELYIPRPPGMGEAGLDVSNLVEDMGLTSWAYSTWYRYFAGLRELGIEEIDGQRFDLENPEWWRRWILDVAHREGMGDAYAEGLARFYEEHEVGPRYLADFIESSGSRGHAWHREGRALEPHPSPFWEYSALLYAVATRDVTPSTHGFFFLNGLYGYPEAPKDPSEISPALQELAEMIYGAREAVHPGIEHVEHVTAWHQHRAIIKDSMSVCDWIFPVTRRTFSSEEEREEALAEGGGAIYGDIAAEAIMYRPCTGIPLSIAEMERPIAERIFNLERCLDIRNYGRSRTIDEEVITHYQWSEKTDGTHISEDAEEFRQLLERYYALRGWDEETGWPTRERLEALDLEDVAQEMARLNELSSSS
ncbi:MAG: aldehyde ferredoxin oxidoreductase N-terminal domain-containing protein [Anaerolineae bacterium]